MQRVLFLPFLRIPTGHHHVADCLMRQLMDRYRCEKIDILSYCYGDVERFVSAVYLRWIATFPRFYSFVYRQVVDKKKTGRRYPLYEWLFLRQVKKLVETKKPDIVICTHALPSYLLNRLKKKGVWSGKVINVYTDYYINDLWGTCSIDYHFVPSEESKEELMEKGVAAARISVTGIPIDPIFKREKNLKPSREKWNVLISGGNMGAGSMMRFVKRLKPQGYVVYFVLCGRNEKLFQQIESFRHPSIQAIPYVASKEKMNQLYDAVDGIISKPGGVTMTECLWKGIPIFVYEALPGQEEFNLRYLSRKGLVTRLQNWHRSGNLESQIIAKLKENRVERSLYFKAWKQTDPLDVIEEICKQ